MSSRIRGLERCLIKGVAAASVRSPVSFSSPAVALESIRSVLLIRIDERVGDLLLTLPLWLALRRALPAARVDFLVARRTAPLIHGVCESLVLFEKRDFFLRPWRFWPSVLRLRNESYDVAIDASHWHRASTTSALLLALSAAKIRICHQHDLADRCATEICPPPLEPEPEVRTKLRLLAPLSIPTSSSKLSGLLQTAATRPQSERKIGDWLELRKLRGRDLVGVFLGGRKPSRRIPRALVFGLCSLIHQAGAEAVVVWGPSERRLAVDAVRGTAAILAPSTSLEDLVALLRACRLSVTGDSGPMHLAVALGIPTLALFQGSDRVRWGHPDPPHQLIEITEDLSFVLGEVKRVLGACLGS